MTRKKLIEPKY